MPIARTKDELLASMEEEYRLLKEVVSRLDEKELSIPGVCHEWSAKDVVAHLVAWKLMFLGWYEEGLRGGNPKTPAEDLNWNQTPILNQRIYGKWKDESAAVILSQFEVTYGRILMLARATPADDLFRKGLFPWMRVWPLARWIAANTSSHYRWGRTRIRRWMKARK